MNLNYGFRTADKSDIAKLFKINNGTGNTDALTTVIDNNTDFYGRYASFTNVSASGHVSSSLFVGIKSITAPAAAGITNATYDGQTDVSITLDLGNLTTVVSAADGDLMALSASSGKALNITRANFLTSSAITTATLANTTLNGTLAGTAVKDEDNMASNSATAVATQQSIKAYVDAQLTAQDLDFQGDSGGALAIDLDSEVLDIAGGSNITTAGSANTLTVSLDNAVSITSLSVGDGNITNVGSIALDSIVADDGSSFSMGNNWTNAGRTVADLGTITTADINGGTLDGTVIGGAAAAAGSFTTLGTSGLATFASATITGDLTVNGTTTTINSTTVTVDDKNLELGSVAVPTNTTAELGGITLKGATDKTFNWTSLGAAGGAAWFSSENLDMNSGKGYYVNSNPVLNQTTLGATVLASSLTSLGTIGSLTASLADINGGAIDGTVIGGATPAAGTFTTLTGNTSLALASGATVTGIADEDNMASDSATLLATQQSIKAYVDSSGQVNYASDTGNGSMALATDRMHLLGGEGMNVTHAVVGVNDTFTFAAEVATSANKGAAQFNTANFLVTAGDVTIKDGGVANVELVNSSLTIGATTVALGATSANLDMNGGEIILDVDGDTSITADTDDQIDFKIAGNDELRMSATAIYPATDVGMSLGTNNNRFADVYTGDLHLKNERGDWTIFEEADHLKVRNNLTGKMFKMALTPVDSE